MVKTTKSIGDEAETRALDYLLSKGYSLIEKNYRYKRNEVDLVVEKNKTLIFVEVKFRKSNHFGFPEDFVDLKKMERLQEAAENLIFNLDWKENIRFDIIAITNNGEVKHFLDVC
jgi:putative endonuclease